MNRFRTPLSLRLAFAAVVVAGLASTPSLAARPKKTPASKTTKPPATTPAKPEGSTPDPRATSPVPDASSDAPIDTGTRKGPSRMEFDDRLVQGQTNKANAIYLFERRESSLRSLLKKRSDFHDEIDEMLEDELVK